MFENMATSSEGKKGIKPKPKTGEEIKNGFNALRNEQRHMANKLSELELELNEHKIVIQTLKEVDGGRKCFRMIGGVLCEKTVKDVLPELTANRDQLAKFIESWTEELSKKGVELNEYKEKYNLIIRGQEEPPPPDNEPGEQPRTGNVLVVNPI